MITFRNSSIICNFTKNNLSGDIGVGIYKLRFCANSAVQNQEDKSYEFRNIYSEIYLREKAKDKFKLVGYAKPEKPLIIKTSKFSHQSSVLFDLLLNKDQINSIEEERGGGDLFFKLNITGETYCNGESDTAYTELLFPVNQKEWINVLKQLNFTEYLLVEIPIPSERETKQIKNSIDFLIQARKNFIEGNYEETVAICRKALESLSKGLGETENQKKARDLFKTNQQEMSLEQRYLMIREATIHFSHLAHHVSNTGERFSINRRDANFILGLTSMIISFSLKSS